MHHSSLRLFSCLLTVVSLAACTQYKPSSVRNQTGNTSAATTGNAVAGPAVDVTLVIANTKLVTTTGALTARILYDKLEVSKDFTPTGAQTTLPAIKLPQGATGVLTVEINQGGTLKFIAKKANLSAEVATGRVVIDDCLILRAPWLGTANESSCEWTITEVN